MKSAKNCFNYFQVVEEVWKFGFSDVIANVGGNLGLFLGGSVMAGYDSITRIVTRLLFSSRKKQNSVKIV